MLMHKKRDKTTEYRHGNKCFIGKALKKLFTQDRIKLEGIAQRFFIEDSKIPSHFYGENLAY